MYTHEPSHALIHKRANWGIMYTFTSVSRAIFGFNFRNSVEHMACSFRVNPLFNCTFVPVSSVLFSFVLLYPCLSCGDTFLFPASLSHLCLLLVHFCIPISCLSLLSYPLILHCPGCYPALISWCVCVCVCAHAPPENVIYVTLCPQSSICVFMLFSESGKREAEF